MNKQVTLFYAHGEDGKLIAQTPNRGDAKDIAGPDGFVVYRTYASVEDYAAKREPIGFGSISVKEKNG